MSSNETILKTIGTNYKIVSIDISELKISSIEDRTIDTKSEQFLNLVKSIEINGLKELIIISKDKYICSGRHRYFALMQLINMGIISGIIKVIIIDYVVENKDEYELIKFFRQFNVRSKTSDNEFKDTVELIHKYWVTGKYTQTEIAGIIPCSKALVSNVLKINIDNKGIKEIVDNKASKQVLDLLSKEKIMELEEVPKELIEICKTGSINDIKATIVDIKENKKREKLKKELSELKQVKIEKLFSLSRFNEKFNEVEQLYNDCSGLDDKIKYCYDILLYCNQIDKETIDKRKLEIAEKANKLQKKIETE